MKSGIAAVVTVATVALLSWTAPASAQVKLEFRNGRVNLNAQNAQIRAILAEWTRVGGTKIVNGERVTGAPVTLELTGVTERQAMEVLLRNTAGYIIGGRKAGVSTASAFGSILILPTSAATGRQVTSAPATARNARNDPEPEPDPEEEPATDTPPDADDRQLNARQIAEEAARQRIADQNARRQQIFVGDQPAGSPTPDGRTAAPTGNTGSNPFGLPPGAARPGVITAPPPQQPNNRGRQPDPEP